MKKVPAIKKNVKESNAPMTKTPRMKAASKIVKQLPSGVKKPRIMGQK